MPSNSNFYDNPFVLLITRFLSSQKTPDRTLLIYPYLRRTDADFDNLQRADIGFERCWQGLWHFSLYPSRLYAGSSRSLL